MDAGYGSLYRATDLQGPLKVARTESYGVHLYSYLRESVQFSAGPYKTSFDV